MKRRIVHSRRSTDLLRLILSSIVLAIGLALAGVALGNDASLLTQNEISTASPAIGTGTGTEEAESEDAFDDQDATETTTQVEPFSPVGPPVVTTRAATSIATFSARLNGLLNPHGLPTTFHFQYGTTTNYGRTTAPHSRTGNTAQPVFVNINGLSPHTRYHFRIVASNSRGTRYGVDRTFTTTTAPACNIAGRWAGTVSGTWYFNYCSWTGTAFISAMITQNGAAVSGVVDEDGVPCFNGYTCGILDFANTTGYVIGSTANCPRVNATYYGTAITGACSGQSFTAPVALTLNGNTLSGTGNGFTVILVRQP